eukprot:TRINITY_DN25794_c0_g2_i1.p1 TRINITY_DN25794_c0_g2~~TRINITY_DN25794_c0_g2_i1.p1  ORF type:complete len:274 (+),score=68.79 TRINITY_DN25794_c0_g2_i1:327-1148(+)
MHHTAITILHGNIWMALVGLLSMFSVSMCAFTFGHHVAACGLYRTLPGEDAPSPAQTCVATVESSDVEEDSDESSGSDRGWSQEDARLRAMDWPMEIANDSGSEDGSSPLSAGSKSGGGFCLTRAERLIALGAAALVLATAALMWNIGDGAGLRALLCAPPGALLRWALSRFNPRVAPMPWFTFLANVLGSAAGGAAAVWATRAAHAEENELALWCTALSLGFAGSLSTVSTFVSELQSEKLARMRSVVFYCFISFTVSLGVLLAINGFYLCS